MSLILMTGALLKTFGLLEWNGPYFKPMLGV